MKMKHKKMDGMKSGKSHAGNTNTYDIDGDYDKKSTKSMKKTGKKGKMSGKS